MNGPSQPRSDPPVERGSRSEGAPGRGRHRRRWDHHPRPGKHGQYLLGLLVVVSLLGVYRILRPFVHAILLALLLGSVFMPVHDWLGRCLGKRRNLTAFLSVLLVSLLVLVPLLAFLAAVVQEGVNTAMAAQKWLAAGNLQEAMESPRVQAILAHPWVHEARQLLRPQIEAWQSGELDVAGKLLTVSREALRFAGTQILPVLSRTGSLLLGFCLTLFVMFYVFRDGREMLAYVLHLSPLKASHEKVLLERIRTVTRAAVLGTILTAAAQAVAAMIAFRIVGIPALFWGTVLGFAALVPVVGTALVWVPAAGYLLVAGRPGAAAFLAGWCVVLVGSLDNLLRPYLMQGRTGMSSAVLLLAILGGIDCFGLVGVLYGPLICGVCAVCLYIYELEHGEYLREQDRQ